MHDLYIKDAGGAAPEQLLCESAETKFAYGHSPDGKLHLFQSGPFGERRVWGLPVGENGKPYRVFPNETGDHSVARFSPDGKWIVYQAGTNVFVQPYPPTGYREQISATQGSGARWTADGRQIVFQGPDRFVMIVDVTPEGGRLRVGAPRPLFQTRQGIASFVGARAERFLMVVPVAQSSEASAAPLTVIANWPSLVTKK